MKDALTSDKPRPRHVRLALVVIAASLTAATAGFVAWKRHRGGEPLRPYGLGVPRSLLQEAQNSPKLEAATAWRAAAKIDARPNVVMITLESVGANRVGYLGYPRDVTPNLDRIARESLVLSRAYSTATHSNYAQPAILSSLFPRRGTTLDMYGRLDYPRVLMHDVAFGLGYETATISSQDETWQGMKRFQTTDTPTFYKHSPDFTGEHLNLISEDIAPDHETADAIVAYIHEHRGAPFSLYVNFQSTHFPYPIPKDAPHPFEPSEPQHTFNFVTWDRAELDTIENRYDNALHYVDIQVGRIFDQLEADGLGGSTILVVTADHGENFFDHDIVTHGRTLFDTEARVPFLVHYLPAVVPERVDVAVSTLDAVPTILDLLGLPPHPAHQGQSVRWLGLPGEEHAAIFMNIQGWKHLDGIVCMPFKVISDPEEKTTKLFDLEADPGELHDLAAEKPVVTTRLRSVLFAQIEAQERYHENTEAGRTLRADRFAPNLLPCPKL